MARSEEQISNPCPEAIQITQHFRGHSHEASQSDSGIRGRHRDYPGAAHDQSSLCNKETPLRLYGIVDSGKSAALSDSLVRYDVVDHSTKTWSVHGHTAGEAIFVADPTSDEEDAGVLMTVVLDGYEGKSYMLVLDPKTMQEVGRAKVPGAVGFGFHGTYVSGSKVDNWGS